jgi:hypothetical protein
MDPNNQQKVHDGSQVPYPAGSPYQGPQIMYGTQGQPYVIPYQGPPFMYGTQGACSGGLNMLVMYASGNVPAPPQVVELAPECNGDGEPDLVELTNPPSTARTGKGTCTKVACRTSNFSNVEDVNIVRSWLEISTDPITNIGQKRDHMWDRIVERYNLRRESSGSPVRTKRSLQSRWDIIKAEVGKFSSVYAECVREYRSGMSDDDKVRLAILFE